MPDRPDRRNKRLDVRIEEDLLEDAEAFAAEHRVTLGAMVRWFFRAVTLRGSRPIVLDKQAIDEMREELKRAPGGGRKPKR